MQSQPSKSYTAADTYWSDSCPWISHSFRGQLPAEIAPHVLAPDARQLNWDTSLLSNIVRAVQQASDSSSPVGPANILLATTGAFRVVPPALAAGFPTALIRREGDIESHVTTIEWNDPEPSLVVPDLAHLIEQLRSPPPLPAPNQTFTYHCRIRDHYELCGPLGAGSFGTKSLHAVVAVHTNPIFSGTVMKAIHLLTGERLAVKMEVLVETGHTKCVLPYETKIYRILHGIPGVPSVRWSGVDGNANVIVMDRLGPTIEERRQFCRGQFSHRTVLMLADQMVRVLRD